MCPICSSCCAYSADAVFRALAEGACLHCFGSLLLGNNLTGVEFDKHGAVSLDFLDRHGQSEVIEEKELKLQVIEFLQRQSTDLKHG